MFLLRRLSRNVEYIFLFYNVCKMFGLVFLCGAGVADGGGDSCRGSGGGGNGGCGGKGAVDIICFCGKQIQLICD